MNFVKSIFWNGAEKRLRAGWRMVANMLILILLLTLITVLAQTLKLLPTATLGAIAPYINANVMWIAMLLALFISGKLLDRRPFKNFGFALNRAWWLDMGFGLALGGLLMAGIFGVEYALGWVVITPVQQPDLLKDLLFSFMFFIGVGIQEEVLTRGYWLRNIAEGLNFKRIGPRAALWISYILSSSIFGLLHLGNDNSSLVSTINLIVAGLFLGLPFVLTGELAISIGIHITWNFFQGNVFGFPVSGTNAGASIITIQQGGPELWTGGAFGPEAGLMGIAAILVGSALIVLWVKSIRQRLAWQDYLAIYPVVTSEEPPAEAQA